MIQPVESTKQQHAWQRLQTHVTKKKKKSKDPDVKSPDKSPLNKTTSTTRVYSLEQRAIKAEENHLRKQFLGCLDQDITPPMNLYRQIIVHDKRKTSFQTTVLMASPSWTPTPLRLKLERTQFQFSDVPTQPLVTLSPNAPPMSYRKSRMTSPRVKKMNQHLVQFEERCRQGRKKHGTSSISSSASSLSLKVSSTPDPAPKALPSVAYLAEHLSRLRSVLHPEEGIRPSDNVPGSLPHKVDTSALKVNADHQKDLSLEEKVERKVQQVMDRWTTWREVVVGDAVSTVFRSPTSDSVSGSSWTSIDVPLEHSCSDQSGSAD